MDQVTLRAEPRTETGSAPARRLRATGRVPAIVYGRGLDAMNVSIDEVELNAALHTESGLNAIINLDVPESSDDIITVAREVQRHPVRGEITHLDFIQVSLDQQIEATVGIEFEGEPVGAEEGGVLEPIRSETMVWALPLEIPSQIVLDVSGMDIGDVLRISDLPALPGVEYLEEPEAPVATVSVPAILEVEEPEEELEPELIGAELEEGEEPAEGEEEAGEAADEAEEA